MRPRVLLSVGIYDWSLHHIARNLVRHLSDRFDFTVAVLKEVVATDRHYDVTISFLWREAERLRMRIGEAPRSIAALFDHVSWVTDQNRQIFERTIRHCTGIVVGNPALAEAVKNMSPRAWVALCQDGVDLGLFRPLPLPARFTVGWCGNNNIGDCTVKGVELIKEGAARAGVPLVTQRIEEKIPQVDMPARFYSQISAYVCASTAEGTPNPVLESLACGRPVISTRVGIVDQILLPGATGIFVGRSSAQIADAIQVVRAWGDHSALCRASVEPHSWEIAAQRWGAAIDRALGA